MSAPEDNIPAMVAALTLADVERNDTVIVLMRQGWRSREIAAVIDEVERRVRERNARLPDRPIRRSTLIALAAVMVLPDPAAAAEAASVSEPWVIGGWTLAVYLLLAATGGGFFGFLTAAILAAGRDDTYPIIVKRGNHWPCRLAVSEGRIICRECGEDSSNGTLPGCIMGEWPR
jgi:hypothetical protein